MATTVKNQSSEMSTKTLRLGLKETANQAKSLSQALKAFDGILDNSVEIDGVTYKLRAFLNECGCKLSTSDRQLTPAHIKRACADMINDGKFCIFKNIHGAFCEPGSTKHNAVYVLTKDGYKVSTKLALLPVGDNKYTADIIIRMIQQGHTFQKYAERVQSSEDEWANTKDIFTLKERKLNRATHKMSTEYVGCGALKANVIFA